MAKQIEHLYTEIGRRIRDLRNRAGMTQEDLGRLLSPPMTRVSVANIEGGHQRVLSHTLVQLAAALNVEVTDILPPKAVQPVANSNARITDELVSKLGLSVSAAKQLAGKSKTN